MALRSWWSCSKRSLRLKLLISETGLAVRLSTCCEEQAQWHPPGALASVCQWLFAWAPYRGKWLVKLAHYSTNLPSAKCKLQQYVIKVSRKWDPRLHIKYTGVASHTVITDCVTVTIHDTRNSCYYICEQNKDTLGRNSRTEAGKESQGEREQVSEKLEKLPCWQRTPHRAGTRDLDGLWTVW